MQDASAVLPTRSYDHINHITNQGSAPLNHCSENLSTVRGNYNHSHMWLFCRRRWEKALERTTGA